MTVLDAHVIASRMSLTERDALLSLAGSRQTKKPKIGTVMLGIFSSKGLVGYDEYGSLVITDVGSAAIRHIRSGL